EFLTHEPREQLSPDSGNAQTGGEAAFATPDPVLSLEAPAAQLRTEDEASPGLKFAQDHAIEDAPQSAPYLLDTSYDDLLGVPIDPNDAQQLVARPAFEPAPVFTVDTNAAAGAGTFTTTNFDPSSFGNYTFTP